MRLLMIWSLLGALATGGAALAAAGEKVGIDPAQAEFFETKIRPVLVERCYKCHSAQAEKIKGKLVLDTREGTLVGGKNGPAVVPGDLDKSLLIKAIRYSDEDLQMPPKEQLAKGVVADFEAWVKMGAPDPRAGALATTRASEIATAKQFWSFQAPKPQSVPNVHQQDWVRSPVDAFVLAKLEEKGLTPAARADKRTLIRRATFDLIGLPATPEEIAAFEADESPEAFGRVVDRLLASPHYGERWGRHWLDVARYSDTKGYVFEEERRYPYSYTYRDWVIRAFNQDLPYDQFLVDQIAADRVVRPEGADEHTPGVDRSNLAAMGFLTVGRRFLNQQPDIIDDRIDVICRGTMGLTVACARCHDHKFDPIPTADYYSLYGIFASSTEPKTLPLLSNTEKTPEVLAYEKDVKPLQEAVDAYLAKRHDELVGGLRSPKQIEEYLLAAQESRGGDGGAVHGIAVKHALSPSELHRWRGYLNGTDGRHPIWGPWQVLAAIPEAEFAAKSGPAIQKLIDDKVRLNPLVQEAMTAMHASSLREVAHAYATLLSRFDKPEKLENADEEEMRQVLRGAGSPCSVSLAEVESLFNREQANQVRDLRKKVDALNVTHAGAPPRAMVMEDLPAPVEQHIFKRGKPENGGAMVPRQFLAILSPEKREAFKNGSGRLELAQKIVSRDNPLTARVLVNRVWQHHFGYGLVRTPGDFGTRGDAPTHPELLDYLAVRFMDEGWSIKKLHRMIMLSSVYQESSEVVNAKAEQVDPENRLLWRMNRLRLDLEAMRDSLLAVSGKLDGGMFGRGVEITENTASHRRTVYGFIERQNLPNLFRTFDFASPDSTSPQRYSTVVPQQALFMMNSPFVVEQAKGLAQRTAEAKDTQGRITELYRLVYGRGPSNDEMQAGVQFIDSELKDQNVPPNAALVAWQYGVGRLDDAHHVTFTPMSAFVGTAWQMGPKLPNAKTGFASLTAQGGHPGNDASQSVIRRWVAPRDCVVAIAGTLSHPSEQGDGVRGSVVAGSSFKAWTVKHGTAETNLEDVEVKRGEVVDFVLDCQQNPNFDSFAWTVSIRAKAGGEPSEWNSAQQFAGPAAPAPKALSAWEKYAQVLLEANEFVFVD